MTAFGDYLRRADYDLVLSGHEVGNSIGLNALEILRASRHDVPFILVATALGEEMAVEYFRRGATNYVRKDRLNQLPSAVEEALRSLAYRKQSMTLQQQILGAKREWELTFDAVPDPVLVIGEDCRIQKANRATSRVFGLPFEQIIGRPCYEVVHGRSDPLPTCPHQSLLRTGQDSPGDIEEPRLGKIFQSTTSPLRDPDGQFHGCVHVLHDVTERKRTEGALRLQGLTLENMYDAVIVVGKDHNITDWNPAATRMFGYEREEALGLNVSSLYPQAEVATQWSRIRTEIESAGRWDGELIALRKDGTRVFSRSIVVPLRNEWGVQIGYICVSRDVTEHKQAEKALSQSEEKYRILFERNPQPMWVYDVPTLRFLAVNQAAVDHYGYSRDEFLSMTLKDIRPPCEIEQMLNSVAQCPDDIDRAGVWQHVTKDGRTILVDITDCRIEFEEQFASLVLANDVTEQERAARQLQESEEKYRQLFENACYGIFRSTDDGHFLDVNSAFVNMLGYQSKTEILGLNIETDIYLNAADRKPILRLYGSDGRRVAAEVLLKRKDGAVISARMNGHILPSTDNGRRCYEVIAEDVTQQRSLEEQFRQAQKMEAVGRLAGGIAHDFNNMIMVVNSYAELIMGRRSQDTEVERYTQHIIRAGERATSLTRQLLAFSRKQMLQPSVLDPYEAASTICKLLPPMLGEDIVITLISEPGLGNIYADRAQVEQVIMNLAVNARDAMPDGGKLLIELKNADVDEQYRRRHPQVEPGKYIVLSVTDTGVGMDANTQASIFEPFFTTKQVGKGTGLGLSTVYGIIKQSGGFIWVYSEPGVGSAFKIYLPRVAAKTTPAPDVSEASRKSLTGSGTVLLVDDDSDIRAATREFLEGKGFKVLEAANGAEALAVVGQHQSEVQILVTDLIMPGMRGTELSRQIAKLHPKITTLYMSGYTDRSQEIMDLGSDTIFLQKPFTLNALVEKLQAALQRQKGSE